MIVGVAIRSACGSVEIRLPKPNRHCHCFFFCKENGIDISSLRIGRKGGDQGFYTDRGIYLNREQAFKHAKRAGQKFVEGENPSKYLFSEDVW